MITVLERLIDEAADEIYETMRRDPAGVKIEGPSEWYDVWLTWMQGAKLFFEWEE